MFELIKKNINYKSGIILFIFTSLMIFIFNSTKKSQPKDISNYIVSVEKGFLSEKINSSGEIKAVRSVKISPRKQGFINTINVEEGDYVKKDALLATLDDKDFIFKLEELKLINEKQKSDYLRRAFLFEEGAISKEDFEDFKNRFNKSNAKLNDALYEKSFYQIKAPFSGTITSKYAEIGSYVAPSSNLGSNSSVKNYIFELSDGMEVIAKVPESDIGRIKINQEALIRIESYPSNKYEAKIIKIAPRAIKDNNVTSFEVTLKFKKPYNDLKVGMTADLEFKVKDDVEKILVPTVSIVTEKGKKGVLKVDRNNSPKFKEIEFGISSGSKTSVIDGLAKGERIFIDIPPWSKRD
tara:strand:- start:5525 stop:6583 length:1059 start_codon:yes stop_codon:yes gene_type:complete